MNLPASPNTANPMTASLQCLSHTPVMNSVLLRPEMEKEVRTALLGVRNRAESFAPDLIVLFGPDHFNGVLYDMMPPYCIGARAQSMGDYGTAAGPLPVATQLAMRCVQSVLDDGVDVAVSHRLRVDHGFTQTLELLTGAIDRSLILPVFVNCIAKPMSPVRRVHALGTAIGRFLKRECPDKRILVVGSGGLSHDPPVPDLETASEPTRTNLRDGRRRTADEQRAHEARVVAAARAFAAGDGNGGGGIMPLNPEWDRRVLDWLCAGDFASLDALSDAEISSQGGSGAHEIRTWVGAFACFAAFGPYVAEVDYYRAIPDWIAGFAIAHGNHAAATVLGSPA